MAPTKTKRSKAPPAAPFPVPATPHVLDLFHPITAEWFRAVFEDVTAPQREGWPAIARGESTLILAPTGTGKTLTAFLWCLDRLMLQPRPSAEGVKVIYISPLKALAVDVERNLRSPLAGIANMAQRSGVPVHLPEISVRTGDTSPKDRARFKRHPGDILITTPESLYLLLTSDAGEALRSVETIIIDEIHALVPTKRGAHMALSLERLEALCGRRLQRIGLSATQRPLEEVARFLGGAEGASTPTVISTEPSPNSVISTEVKRSGEIPAFPPESAPPSNETTILNFANDRESDDSAGNASAQSDAAIGIRYRPVTIVNAGARKVLELRVEVPVEDMARLGAIDDLPSGPASQGPKRTSIWQSIHPRLLEIVRERTSTLVFVNARRVAERLAGALNELAGEDIARAHHGSLAAAQRSEIEEKLKAGQIKALVCTSSLELGIDMGAVDLVVQIEAPPSVASGMQRIGRAGHQVGAPSAGIIFPKYRADLIACAAVTEAMHAGHVESTRFLRNPLDVLAQQMVALVAHPPIPLAEKIALNEREVLRKKKRRTALVSTPNFEEEEEARGISYDELFAIVRSTANFAGITTAVFEGVLDMLAGRYPSDEFAELRPRVTWDRTRNWITPRQGVKRIAILNGGTIPDRGLYGVFLSGTEGRPVRVGELDEEMVFEARTGETFVLGASTWRIDDITHDRVLVSPAPGEPGKMPFWHGDRAGRPIEFGRRIGALMRELRELPHSVAVAKLTKDHDLDERAAENVLRYLVDQAIATDQIPDDRTIVIERVRDELGDWRMCVLTPLGSKIHAPWAMAATAKIKAAGLDVETMWSEDGFVLRFPESDTPPDVEPILLDADEAAELVMQQLGSTALFAAKFREAASRALLLPRRRADGRTPLWQQRKRAYDLLSVASRYASFPILLEAYRECLRDVFDMPALMETLRAISQRQTRVHVVDSRTPSPFAGALLFSYVANYIYDGDAPLAERRAQALSIDQDQLRELMGDADLRELLDAAAIEEVEEQLQCIVDPYKARSIDGIHDLLLRLGDLTRTELAARFSSPDPPPPPVILTDSSLSAVISTDSSLSPVISTDPSLSAVISTGAKRSGEIPAFSLDQHAPPSAALKGTGFSPSINDQREKELQPPRESPLTTAISRLLKARRVLELMVAGEKRLMAVEDAARLRDALGVPLPPGLPTAFLQPVPDALHDIIRRFARTHGPFATQDIAHRYGLSSDMVEATLQRLVQSGRVAEGGFRPGGVNREWIDSEVLRSIRRKSLAKLRKEVEPVEQRTLARLFTRWQGVVQPRRGLDALLDVIENLQGAPLPASLLEREILPARLYGYQSADLDTLIAAGEVVWVGLDPLGERDGRIGLYLAEKLPLLWPPDRTIDMKSVISTVPPPTPVISALAPSSPVTSTGAQRSGEIPAVSLAAAHSSTVKSNTLSDREQQIITYLRTHGASFFQSLHDGLGGGYPGETLEALWSLVWRGLLTNDALHALRAYCERTSTSGRNSKPVRRIHNQAGFRSRRTTPPTAQGRWSLNSVAFDTERNATAWSHAIAQQLLTRYGVVFRETAHAESLPGGFSAVYDVLKAMEESGKVRRGYFAAGEGLSGATQFAMPAAVDLLRSLRVAGSDDPVEVVMLAATDPANPYGSLLRWPAAPEEGTSLTRTVGARVILADGALTMYLRRGNPNVQVILPEEEPARSRTARALAEFLVFRVQAQENEGGERGRGGLLITTVNGVPVVEHFLARFLLDAGFQAAPLGFNVRRNLPGLPANRAEAAVRLS